ncbi:MAG: hypothetical protein KC656_25550, partial [Myxococcales bacterium]|nr:hypothetical protein [Myxococcales bacterium]
MPLVLQRPANRQGLAQLDHDLAGARSDPRDARSTAAPRTRAFRGRVALCIRAKRELLVAGERGNDGAPRLVGHEHGGLGVERAAR